MVQGLAFPGLGALVSGQLSVVRGPLASPAGNGRCPPTASGVLRNASGQDTMRDVVGPGQGQLGLGVVARALSAPTTSRGSVPFGTPDATITGDAGRPDPAPKFRGQW